MKNKDSSHVVGMKSSISGVVAKMAMFPMTKIKIIMQTHGVGMMEAINKTELHHLYKGSIMMCSRAVPIHFVKFSTFDLLEGKMDLLPRCLAAGVMQGIASSPIEIISQKSVIDNMNSMETTRNIWRNYGIRGFYHYFPLNMLISVAYVGTELYTYNTMKEHIDPFMAGFATGIISQTAVYPLDSSWRRLVSGLDMVYDLRVLYRGSAINMIRCGLISALQFKLISIWIY